MTKTTLLRQLVLTALVLCASGPTQAYAGTIDRGRYVLFIHAGPKPADDATVKQIAAALVKSGYLVRAPDAQQDIAGGPGVDFFDASAEPAARDVAEIMNKFLKAPGKMKPRPQRSKSPRTYLGVWLF